jgi:hypothetical protein
MASLLLLVVVFSANAFGGETREIELIDGSVIYGEVVSLSEGVYTLKTGGFGTIRIEEQKIRAIRLKGSEGAAGEQIQTLQQTMMSDEEIINIILSMQNDPDIQRVLEDPSIMKAVASGDVNALLSNPKFMKLLDKPEIRDITRKVPK